MTAKWRSAQESFETLYEEAPCGYLSTLPDGEIVQVNRTFLSFTGYSADELCAGKRFAALLPMPSALLYETYCTPLLRLRGSVSEIALDILCRDGKPLPVLLNAAVKTDAQGAPCLFRLVILSAPTRREYERELLRARTEAEEATEQVRIHRELAERKVAEQHELLKAVERITAGDLETPVVIESSSSQAQLARGLDRMRWDIRKQIRELKDRNTEVQQLNVELRHQIEKRSRLMVESMQSGMVSGAISGMDYSAVEVLPIFASGTLLAGRYRIRGILGQGAMGTVYEVDRISDGGRFAAKVLSVKPDYPAMARFAREAQLLARLQHPSLIAIVDTDVTDDRVAYIVMELARGKSLAELSARYRDRDFMLPLLLQIAEALTVVHDAGVVHRDLKPANVLISMSLDGIRAIAKLVDFGVSRLLDAAQDAADAVSESASDELRRAVLSVPPGFEETIEHSRLAVTSPPGSRGSEVVFPRSALSSAALAPAAGTPDPAKQRASRSPHALTQAGALVGTLLYMAPELLSGSNMARPPSDIFSFGVMAYEVLTGILPFSELPLMLAARGTSELSFAPLQARCPGLDQEPARILERCLAVDPACRPTARELTSVLSKALFFQPPVSSRP